MKSYRKYEGLSPIYQGTLTNHLPMLFGIIEPLSLPKNMKTKILDHYKKDKDLYELTDPMYPKSTLEEEYIRKTSYYLGELHKYGVDVVVGTILADHSQSLHSALYHGIIRLAYALRTNDDLMIAQAIAYFVVVSEPLEVNTISNDIQGVDTAYKRLVEYTENNEMYRVGSTMEVFHALLNDSLISKSIPTLRYPSNYRGDILSFFLEEYTRTQSFYALHVITGLDALFELEGFLPDFDQVFQQFIASSIVYMLIDCEDKELDIIMNSGMPSMVDVVLECDDVHVIKLIDSLQRLHKQYPNQTLSDVAYSVYQASVGNDE